MRKKLRVLLTCCLGYYMAETIACMKDSSRYDVTIVGLDMNPMEYNINDIDIFYQVPGSDSPDYFDIVFEIARKEQVDVVMPLHSRELVPFCQRRELFAREGMILAVPPLEGLTIANDKILSYEYMLANGFPVPRTLVTASPEEAMDFVRSHDDMQFVTKLADSCGARGFHIIEDPQSLKTIMDGKTPTLIQTYLPGTEYTVDLLLQDGICVAGYTKQCLKMEHGVIRQAKITDSPQVLNLCIRFAESLHLSGNIGFDLKCDAAGNPLIIDVNPRITATIGLGRYGGLNLPELGLHSLFEKLPTQFQGAKPGIRIVRQIADYYFDDEEKML